MPGAWCREGQNGLVPIRKELRPGRPWQGLLRSKSSIRFDTHLDLASTLQRVEYRTFRVSRQVVHDHDVAGLLGCRNRLGMGREDRPVDRAVERLSAAMPDRCRPAVKVAALYVREVWPTGIARRMAPCRATGPSSWTSRSACGQFIGSIAYQ